MPGRRFPDGRGVDYGAVADRLLKMSARMAKQRRRSPPPPRLDAFVVKACIDSLQRELAKVELLAGSFKTGADMGCGAAARGRRTGDDQRLAGRTGSASG